MVYVELYEPDKGREDHGYYDTEDESDEELAKALALSRKEF